MAIENYEVDEIERKVHDLAKAMEETRSSLADRDDVVVDMKQSKISRLELLAGDLKPVFNDIPKDNDQFEFALTNGETPRLWIDMTTFVRMAADGREYEVVKDTRLGRTILARSEKRDHVGEAITTYVAERILERERILEGEWIQLNGTSALSKAHVSEETAESDTSSEHETNLTQDVALKTGLPGWFLFSLGVVVGLAGLWVAVVLDQIEPLIQWLRGLTG